MSSHEAFLAVVPKQTRNFTRCCFFLPFQGLWEEEGEAYSWFMNQMLCFCIIAQKKNERKEKKKKVALGSGKEKAFGVSQAWVSVPALPCELCELGGDDVTSPSLNFLLCKWHDTNLQNFVCVLEFVYLIASMRAS